MLTKLETRISALATLYDVLFAHGGIGDIDLAIYLDRVAAHAAESLGAEAMNIHVDCEFANLRLDIKRAVPLGLAVNEIITDCVKYGFTGRKSGRIRIALAQRDGRLILEAEDDGIGWPPGFVASEADGFGIGLVAMLAQQLGASFVTDDAPGGGARFRLELGL